MILGAEASGAVGHLLICLRLGRAVVSDRLYPGFLAHSSVALQGARCGLTRTVNTPVLATRGQTTHEHPTQEGRASVSVERTAYRQNVTRQKQPRTKCHLINERPDKMPLAIEGIALLQTRAVSLKEKYTKLRKNCCGFPAGFQRSKGHTHAPPTLIAL